MKIGTSIIIGLLAGAFLLQPAEAKPVVARIKDAAQNAKITVQGRTAFASWLLGNKAARATYRAEIKAAGVGKERVRMAASGALAAAGLFTIFKGNVMGAYAAGFFGISAAQAAVKISGAKSDARFATVSNAVAGGEAVPKSVLRMYVRDADRRIVSEQKALAEARDALTSAQAQVTAKEQLIPTIETRRQQAATSLSAH